MPTVRDARRVLIIGPPGSGKSTLARHLSRQLDLPLIHLDAEFWRPGWVQTPRDAWLETVRALVAADSWLIEGNYAGTLALRAPRADLIVLLDLPRRVTIPRVLRRVISYHGRTRPDLAPDCPERFDLEFLRYCWRFARDELPVVIAALNEADAWSRVARLRTTREIKAWVERANAG